MKATSPIFIHYVHDMKRAIEFYRAVFDVMPSFESAGWSTLDFNSFELALHILSPGHDDESVMPHAGLNMSVEFLDEMRESIEAGGGSMVWLREPEPHIPERIASFCDTEGNRFELRQPMGSSGQ
tara:strand:+ start:1640 stop:2014 length:375 start_codon:yes stop_codon:yes gene_type:complete